ncbi:MAG: aminotransferase class V-fold PLP-dependent enzyme [Cyclobacteriaceae bacterium]|nr:aminotransferase class V-fold PLP-dependent enzyme [Cyclobacteriaceae bacterium]
MITRRILLKRLAGLPVVGGLFGSGFLIQHQSLAGPVCRDFFKELGVRTFINAAGTYTAMTGSLMLPEVVEAIHYASGDFVNLDELQDKVGARLAELLHCEAATVTSGAASAITLGTAGILTGMDEEKIIQLPVLTGMKNEVIIQKKHRIVYDHAIRNCGVKLVEVETRQDLEKAINKNTAMMWFLNANNFIGQIRHEEFIEVAKNYNIPTFNDAAADVPPVENLWKYTGMGFDLVAFSGGKGLRGPQSAGLLIGKKDYIQAARMHAAPRGNTIGRGMKVNKEEILGMLVAIEYYLNNNHEQDWVLWEKQIKTIHDAAASVPHVKAEVHVPEIANHVPSLRITWDQEKIPLKGGEIREKLRWGHPSIETVGGDDSIGITTWMLRPGQERIVAARLKEVLSVTGSEQG